MDAANPTDNSATPRRGVAATKLKRRPKAPPDLAGLEKQAAEAARMLKLIGNERRLLILCSLAAQGEMKVGDIVEAVGLSQSALSQHLALLRADRLVTFRRESQTLYYRISDPRAARLLKLLKDMYCGDL
jgi:ArsR family transcriptional regulator, virulence genes transcriptional regulator